MSAEIIQADFGGFNPRFVGISLKLNSYEAFQILYDFLTSEAPPSGEPSSLQEIATKSVLDHEIRHYHDFLISPYSSQLFRMRLQALVNGVQALNRMPQLEANCLPAPLSRWLVMGEAERAAQLEDWRVFTQSSGCPEWRPVVVPFRSGEALLTDLPPMIADIRRLPVQQQFDLYLEVAVRGYLRIEQITQGFGDTARHPELRPCNVYEATALTAQIVSIYQSQGLLPAVQFIKYLLESNLGYALLWQRFLQMALLLEKQRHPGIDEGMLVFNALPSIMVMGVWCLLGNYQLESTKACPTVRFENLLLHLVEN
jgi:hypothetical protein